MYIFITSETEKERERSLNIGLVCLDYGREYGKDLFRGKRNLIKRPKIEKCGLDITQIRFELKSYSETGVLGFVF